MVLPLTVPVRLSVPPGERVMLPLRLEPDSVQVSVKVPLKLPVYDPDHVPVSDPLAVAVGVAVAAAGVGVTTAGGDVAVAPEDEAVGEVDEEPQPASERAANAVSNGTNVRGVVALYSGSVSGEERCMGAEPSSAVAASLKKAISGCGPENVISRPEPRWTAVPLTPSGRSPSPGLQTRTMKVSMAWEAKRGASGGLKAS